MLTERGASSLGAGLGLLALWAALGEVELLGAAILLLAVTAAALLFGRWWRPTVEVHRRLYPGLVHEGDMSVVEMAVENGGPRSLRNATVTDRVGDLGTAEFSLASLPTGASAVGSYQIVCRPRGVYLVGPAQVTSTDPMRLVTIGSRAGSADRLIVYPEVEDLTGFPAVRGHDPSTQASRPEASRRGGEDFYTLREYQVGDDLRQVHWPSSAKRDELMIRQLETPWQARALVFLDVRRRVYQNGDCFEKAVRGAASVIRHLRGSGFDADLWAGGTGTIPSHQYRAVMETLAMVQPLDRVDVRAAAARIRRKGSGGALVLVTGVPDQDIISVHQLLSRQFGALLVMAASTSTPASIVHFQRAGAATMVVPPDGSWAAAWVKATARQWTGSASAG